MVNRGLNILIVDDEPMVRQSIVFLLKHLGHRPETAEGPRAALNLLKQRPFDIVITDFSMPEMLGDELVFRMRQIMPGQRIIMITAFVEDYRVLGKESGNVDALLIKPFSIQELNEAIERVADSGAAHDVNTSPELQAH